jgi:hypothetical protein
VPPGKPGWAPLTAVAGALPLDRILSLYVYTSKSVHALQRVYFYLVQFVMHDILYNPHVHNYFLGLVKITYDIILLSSRYFTLNPHEIKYSFIQK